MNLYNRSGSPNENKVIHIYVQYLKINEQENYYEGIKHSIFIWEYHTSKISDLSIVLAILIFYKIFCFCIYIHNGLYIKWIKYFNLNKAYCISKLAKVVILRMLLYVI